MRRDIDTGIVYILVFLALVVVFLIWAYNQPAY